MGRREGRRGARAGGESESASLGLSVRCERSSPNCRNGQARSAIPNFNRGHCFLRGKSPTAQPSGILVLQHRRATHPCASILVPPSEGLLLAPRQRVLGPASTGMLQRLTAPLRRRLQTVSARYYISTDELFGDEIPEVLNVDNSKTVKNFQAYPINKKIKGKYMCVWSKETNKSIFDVIKLLTTTSKRQLNFPGVSDSRTLLKTIVPDKSKIANTTAPHVTWMGHASCYFQTEGCYFLTDPVWSSRASPLSFLGPKRYLPPPIEVEDLKIDVVMLSHTHYDHLDIATAKRIGNRATWYVSSPQLFCPCIHVSLPVPPSLSPPPASLLITGWNATGMLRCTFLVFGVHARRLVPLGVGKILKSVGVTNVVEMDWWDTYDHLTPAGSNIEVMFVPSKHWTSRTPFDRNTCLWGGFALMGRESKFYFCGDTAYANVFKLIGDNLGPFDLAAVPIGAYTPRWFMKNVHCSPDEALQIHLDLRAKQSVAVHWGMFPLTEEDPVEPALELARIRDQRDISPSQFFTMALGETLQVGAEPQNDFATQNSQLYKHYLEVLLSGTLPK